MALQSTNRVKIGKVREAVFGVTPATPAIKGIRETSSSLAANPQTVVSNEIRSDRQITDLILTGYQAGGDIAGEVSFGAIDDDLEEALQGTWSNAPSITVATLDTEISDLSATTMTVAAGGAAFKASMIALLQGFPTAGNNKRAKISSSTGTTVVFPASTFVAETAPIPVGASLRVVGFQGASGDIAAVVDGLTSASLDFTTLGLVPGQSLKVGSSASGAFATLADNDFVRVSAVAAHKITLDRLPVGWTADAGTGQTIEVFFGDFLINGSTLRTNTIERQYLDHSPVTYEYLRGLALGTLAFSAASAAIATYSKTYVGSDVVTQTARFTGATDVPAPTNSVLNTASNVGRIGFDGSLITGPNFVKTAAFSINNNLRRQDAIGTLGAVGIGNGEFAVTGTLDTYFGDKTLLDKIVNNTLTSFDLRMGRQDGNKQTILFDFPSIKLSGGSPAVSGKNADVMISSAFQAFMDATLGYTMSAQRFWFLP